MSKLLDVDGNNDYAIINGTYRVKRPQGTEILRWIRFWEGLNNFIKQEAALAEQLERYRKP